MSNPSDPNQQEPGQWNQGQGQWDQPNQGQWQQGQQGPPQVSIGGPSQQWQQWQQGQQGPPGPVERYERGVDRAMVHVDRALSCGQLVYSGCFLLFINLVMLGFLGLSYYFFSGGWHLAQNGSPTTGVVVDFEEDSSASSGVTYSPIVQFTAGGKTYEFNSGASSDPPAYDVGEEVPVLYDPEDPETAEIVSGMTSPYIHAGVFGIQLIALLVINIFSIRRIWRGQPLDDE